MVNYQRIPAEVRWMIASRSIPALAADYGMAVESTLGVRSDEVGRDVFARKGAEVRTLAVAFGMPHHDAGSVAETLGTIASIYYGPEYLATTMAGVDDRAVLNLTSCPILNRLREADAEPQKASASCQAFCRAAVEGLNPEYTIQQIKGMCTGESYCQMLIGRR